MIASFHSAWNAFWFSEAPAERLACFRIVHGLTLLLYLSAWWMDAPEWLGDKGYHLSGAMLHPLSPSTLIFFAILQFSAIGFLIAGWQVRAAAAVSFGCLLAEVLIDRVSSFSINRIYLFTLFVFIIYGAPQARKAVPILVTPVRILQIALVALYFSSGWNKAVWGDWIDSPSTLRTIVQGIYMTEFAAFAVNVVPLPIWTLLQFAILAFELFSPILFFSARMRGLAILAGCMFHIGIALFMDKLIFFSLQMMSFYVLFLPDDWLTALWRRARKSAQGKAPSTPVAIP